MTIETTAHLLIPMALLTCLACNSGTTPDAGAQPEPGPTTSDKSDKSDEKEAAPAPEPAADAAPEGYEAHMLAALTEIRAGKAPAKSEVKPYGCSVKYGDAGGEVQAKIGEAAPAFSLPNLDGEQVSLADFAGKTVVLEWFNPDCPFVKYAHGVGPLQSMASEHGTGEVVWLAINSGAPGKQGHGVERNREAAKEWKLEHPILIDDSGAVGHSYGAKTTPHMFVVDAQGKLAYAGGLDNAPLGRPE